MDTIRQIVATILILVSVLVALAEFGLRSLHVDFGSQAPADAPTFDYQDSDLAILFAKYDAVFIGRVKGFNQARMTGLLALVALGADVARDTHTTRLWEDRLPGVVFEVERAWKGLWQTEVAMPIGFMDSGDRCWGRHFDVGKRYLVYAYSYESDFETSLCDPTTEFPYTFHAEQTRYDLPDGIPDLDLIVVGSGYAPTEHADRLRLDIQWVPVMSCMTMLIGVLLATWPRLRRQYLANKLANSGAPDAQEV